VSHGRQAPLPAVDGLLAGVAEVDITPPPGLPKAGYSSNANDGDGFRTRLRARVFHLRSGVSSLAIVQCDLLGGSSVLQHMVAEQIRDRTDVPLAGLMIGATHTHAGPGQFLGTDFYNRFASNRPGFDPEWTAFLVESISRGVIEACSNRRPAMVATGVIDVWGWTRNRSMPPHVTNETVADKRTEPQRKYASVNPELHMIRIDDASGETAVPMGAAILFSVHGTGVSMRSSEYNADVWAYLVGEARLRIRERTGVSPVVGAMEGTHADIAPAIRPRSAGYLESARVGRGIGAAAAELHDRLGSELRSEIGLAVSFAEIDLDRQRQGGSVTLPHRPAVGAALVAGATENVTPVIHRVPPFRAGSPKSNRPHRHHGEKRILGSELGQAAALPLRSFPRVVPVQVLVCGDTAVAGLPFEITREAGRRLRRSVEERLDPSLGVTHVAVSSVCNEYYGYVTTPEEYSVQFYEGGHTLYGPSTLEFLCHHLGEVAGEASADAIADRSVPARRFDLKVREFWPAPTGVAVDRVVVSQPEFFDPTATEDGYWEFSWADVAPGDLEWNRGVVAIEVDSGGGWLPAVRRGEPLDDDSWWIQVTYLGRREDRHLYRARWFEPLLAEGVRHRFAILPNGPQGVLHSNPFD
jgi:neutral ceramidase